MTHDELIELGKNWLSKQDSIALVESEIGVSPRSLGYRGPVEIADIIAWRWDTSSIVIEVKTSRADFLRDAKKPCRKVNAVALGNELWYLCPKGIVDKSEVPAGWGLLVVKGKRIYKEKLPKRRATTSLATLKLELKMAIRLARKYKYDE